VVISTTSTIFWQCIIVEQLSEDAWNKNLYTHWLAVLRELSIPTTDSKYPDAMRTRAWALRDTNTQMASWTQLRHDTVLYVKQSYGRMLCCSYPSAYVDPRPQFWQRFQTMATAAAKIISDTHYPIEISNSQEVHANFFINFGDILGNLKEIAQKEISQQPLSSFEENWLKTVTRVRHGGSGPPTYDGWFCELFYKRGKDAVVSEYLVADVHTNPPDDFQPGSVLHQGVGKVNMMIISINSGPDRAVYVGPVFSHFEFSTKGVKRVSDAEWSKQVEVGDVPKRSKWTKDFLISYDSDAPFSLPVKVNGKEVEITVRSKDPVNIIGETLKKEFPDLYVKGMEAEIHYKIVYENTKLQDYGVTRRDPQRIRLLSPDEKRYSFNSDENVSKKHYVL